MSESKVCIFVPTVGDIEKPTIDSIKCQTYKSIVTVISDKEARYYSSDYIINLYKNCSENRNEARERALNTDATYFLSLDSDVVLPQNAISELVKQMRDDNRVVGGWYKMVKSPKWVAGKWIADNKFINYLKPFPSLISTDVVGLGCAMMNRKTLENIKFEDGTNLFFIDENNKYAIVGECGMFGNRCYERNIPMYMDGDVICEHLIRKTK